MSTSCGRFHLIVLSDNAFTRRRKCLPNYFGCGTCSPTEIHREQFFVLVYSTVLHVLPCIRVTVGHFVASFGPQRSVSWRARSYAWNIYSSPRACSRLNVDLPSFLVPPFGLELCHSYHSIPSRQGQRTSEHRGTAPILFPSQGRKSSRPRAGAAGPPTFVHLTSYPPLIHEKVFKTSLERNSTNEL